MAGQARFNLEFSGDQLRLKTLAKVARAESDGKAIRKDMAEAFKLALDPVAQDARSAILNMSTSGGGHAGPSLRAAVAKNIKVQLRTSGRATGARLAAQKTKTLRGFALSPKRLNSAKGWRRRVFGTATWVVQRGLPGFFDKAIAGRRSEMKRAAEDVMKKFEHRIKI